MAFGIDVLATALGDASDASDAIADDPDVSSVRVEPRAVDDDAVADDQVEVMASPQSIPSMSSALVRRMHSSSAGVTMDAIFSTTASVFGHVVS